MKQGEKTQKCKVKHNPQVMSSNLTTEGEDLLPKDETGMIGFGDWIGSFMNQRVFVGHDSTGVGMLNTNGKTLERMRRQTDPRGPRGRSSSAW